MVMDVQLVVRWNLCIGVWGCLQGVSICVAIGLSMFRLGKFVIMASLKLMGKMGASITALLCLTGIVIVPMDGSPPVNQFVVMVFS